MIAYLKLYVGGGVPDAPCNLVQLPNCKEGSRPLPTERQQITIKPFVLQPRTCLRGVEDAAPYEGRYINRQACNWALPPNSTGGYRIRPYANQKFGPGGVNVGRVQSAVKKMQSFLHF